jgi:hypothetical protein
MRYARTEVHGVAGSHASMTDEDTAELLDG